MALRFTDAVFQQHASVATPADGIFLLKKLMKAAGWTVLSSGDGTTLFAASDGITTGGSGAGGLNNVNAWWRIRCPDLVHEMTVQRIAAASSYRVKTANAPFTGGSPSATQTPTAVGEVTRLGGGTDAAPTGAAWWLDTTGMPHAFFGGADREPPYGVYSVGAKSTTNLPHAFVFIPILAARPTDPDPYLYIFHASRSGLTGAGVNSTNWTEDTWLAGVAGADPDGGAVSARHGLIGDAALETTKGFDGIAVVHSVVGGNLLQVYTEEGEPARTLIRLNTFLIPWNGTLPVLPAGYADAGAVRIWTSELGTLLAGAPPVLESLTPAPGQIGADEETARFIPITAALVITMPDQLPMVFARVGAAPHSWHLVYDGAEFEPLFEDHSTVEQSGDSYAFSVLPTGGWWATPVELVFGQFQEAEAA